MRRVNSVGVILLLGLGCLAAPVLGQTTGGGEPSGGRERGFRLQQNYPNPFNPETKIPFELEPALFEGGQAVKVTIRIFNVLQQLVAVPAALNHPDGQGRLVEELPYESPGVKEAFWNGRDRNGRKVASGIYFVQLRVNGLPPQVMKMIVAK